jgi:hypothetical protein
MYCMDQVTCLWAPNCVYSCSQDGVAAAKLTVELSEGIIPVKVMCQHKKTHIYLVGAALI